MQLHDLLSSFLSASMLFWLKVKGIPAEMKSGVSGISGPTAGISFGKIPFFMMDKIGIEHLDSSDSKQVISTASKAEACYTVKLATLREIRREIQGFEYTDKWREMRFEKAKSETPWLENLRIGERVDVLGQIIGTKGFSAEDEARRQPSKENLGKEMHSWGRLRFERGVGE
ncbi:hypothetical protein COLO4_27456 [Corchorus olitorius]|uniref:Uncharacterized protein n=1 Tax=Corchorus olitorius TaxID=93759 RepID=A0A1R3HRH2_9ROSI|nr:hypothetical protein COLO4_27456 [Corchorus olitorius]